MSAQVIPYVFDDNLVRIVMREGEPWFVATDVCRVLNIANSRDAIVRLDEDEKADVGITDTSSTGVTQARAVSAISEPGVYRLVFTSRKAEAEAFKRWLAHEVIPSIRKTGAYAMPEAIPSPEWPAAPRTTGMAAPVEAEPMVAGEPLSALRLRLDIVREARLNFGSAHARKLWHDFGLPHSAGRGGVPDEGRSLLMRLLQARLMLPDGGAGWLIEDAIHLALGHDKAVTRALFLAGLRADEKHLWIANKSAFINEVMAGCEDWRKHLLAIPGAHSTGPRRVGREIANGIHVPMAECNTALLG